ncbi:MAG: formylglycine-generating enzyme family protein, partial [Planctomycetes bacterium]|nr:formylglycine-generating enzyme family protein [Planctomycetota bacterium]
MRLPWLARVLPPVVLCAGAVVAVAAWPWGGTFVADGMLWIPAGEAVLGSQDGDADAPLHRVRISGFWLDATEVTNAQFAAFVAATGHVTDAERPPFKADVPDLPDDQR